MAMMDNIPKEWIEERWQKALDEYPLETVYDKVTLITVIEALQQDKRVSRGIMGDYIRVARGRINSMLKDIGKDEDNQGNGTRITA